MKTMKTLLLMLAVVLLASCGEEKKNSSDPKERLAAYVEDRDSKCPLDIEEGISIISLDYDEDVVTVKVKFDDSEMASYMENEEFRDAVKNILLTNLASNDSPHKKLITLASKAKASVCFACKCKSATETYDLLARSREVRNAVRNARNGSSDANLSPSALIENDEEEEVVDDEEEIIDDEEEEEPEVQVNYEQVLTDAVNNYQGRLPRRLSSGINITGLQLTGQQLLFLVNNDEADLTIQQMRMVQDAVKTDVFAAFDADMRQMASYCSQTGRSIAFRYSGLRTGDTLLINLTLNDLMRIVGQ